MPYMKNGKRDYAREKQWDKENGRYEERAARKRARRAMEREGKVTEGDGKQVDHKRPISKGGSNSTKNLRVTSAKSNMSFSRNKDGSMKSQTSRREGRKK